MERQELVPLEEGIRIPQPRHSPRKPPRACARGPLRLCRLLALAILLPCMFVLVPLYLRYRVYSGQMYPMSMTDMRLIDGKISPTWCQRQVVYSNATFNAYVLPGAPTLAEELVPVTMTRELELEDDMKEYWGFYLLKGSSVTVSACTRWPGASLIMIKGYKHLQECAYIGDDSSEEVDELLEAKERGLLSDTVFMEKMTELRKTKIDGKANDPGTMRRHKTGVSFHDPSHGENATSADPVPSIDVTDPNELAAILEKLHAIRQAAKTEMFKHYKPPDHLTAIKALHRHRDANVDKDERKWLFFKDIDGNNSEQVTQNVNTQNTLLNALKSDTRIEQQTTVLPPKKKVISEINKNDLENGATVKATTDSKTDITLDVVTTEKPYLTTTTRKKSDVDVRGDKTTEETTTIKTLNIGERARLPVTTRSTTMKTLAHIATGDVATEAPVAETNSKEVFEEVFQRLQKLGDKGKRVLVRLHERMGVNYQKENKKLLSDAASSSEELERIRRVLVEAIDEENNRPERQQKRRDARSAARAKRELMLGQIELEKELNEDDEARNFAAEEVLEDGHANIHDHVNETTAFDMSNSEFWSSFSSSEEALLECEGLILNLPLTPHSGCHPQAGEEDSARAARANALTYRVPANGYYFFVFNSENEVQTNFIKAKFDLQKTRYDVARTTLRECRNSTERCDLSLDIFSSQKVVLEVPLRNNDSLWNEQFVILSECEPRTSVYLVCVLSVPVLILLFAFQ